LLSSLIVIVSRKNRCSDKSQKGLLYGLFTASPIAYTGTMHFFFSLIPLIVVGIILLTAALITISWRQARKLTHNSWQKRQQRYLDSPELQPLHQLEQYRLDAESLELTTADGETLSLLYRPSRNRATIILCHGYKMDCSEMIPIAAMLERYGYGVALPDLRSHGNSSGEKIYFGYHEWQDIETIVEFILERHPQETLGLFGNSMGGALALCYTARDPRISAVIAQSPYASIAHTIHQSVHRFTGLPPFPFATLINYFAQKQLKFDSAAVAPLNIIGAISPRAILLMMGGQDQVVPSDGIFALHQAAGQPVELWYDEQLDHVEFYHQHPVEFERRVSEFFARYLHPSP
jgi:alpha-beta hydrolase superfamily lysophospholipase